VRSRDFALIVVRREIVFLIALIVVHLTAAERTELGIAGRGADGAIYQAIFNVLDPRQDER